MFGIEMQSARAQLMSADGKHTEWAAVIAIGPSAGTWDVVSAISGATPPEVVDADKPS